MGEFTFNGISSSSFGLVVEKVPAMNRPARKYDRYSVPGRNGDIFVMQDAWENVEVEYDIFWAGDETVSATDIGYSITEWLFGPTGYQTLTDGFDADHFRKAVFVGPFDVENILMKYGRARVTFDCDPRRFLTSGMEWTALSADSATEIENPTGFIAAPVIELTGLTTQGGTRIRSTNGDNLTSFVIIDSGSFVIDSSRETIAQPDGTPAFNVVRGSYPLLWPGANSVTIDTIGVFTYFESAKIQPNWWTI